MHADTMGKYSTFPSFCGRTYTVLLLPFRRMWVFRMQVDEAIWVVRALMKPSPCSTIKQKVMVVMNRDRQPVTVVSYPLTAPPCLLQ